MHIANRMSRPVSQGFPDQTGYDETILYCGWNPALVQSANLNPDRLRCNPAAYSEELEPFLRRLYACQH